MFIPYRASIKITRIPVMTIVVTVVCLLVFWAQERNFTRIIKFAESFCTESVTDEVVRSQKLAFPFSKMNCAEVLAHIYLRLDAEQHLARHVERIETQGDPGLAQALVRHYRDFARQAPGDLTAALLHRSGSWNPLNLLSATIAHGSWDHVIGNLFFFVAFAMVVETVIGPVLFLLVFLAMGLGSGALENLLTATREGGGGLGLSGVVMSMLALAAYLAPRVKIKFFYFYFLMFGVLSWPLWSVASWYVFWNLWDYYFWRDYSNVGYVAHLTGAVMGLILGLALFRKKRHWVTEQLVVEELTLKDDESWLYKFNVIGATPVVAFFVFFYVFAALIIGTWLIVLFFKTFAVQLLIAAPAVAALVQIWRMKQPKKPDWVRLQEGLKCLDAHRFRDAERILRPLAESGYPRGQFALGRYYAGVPGAWHSDPQAMHWFEAAAKRGLPEAQYELGTRYVHGHGIGKDPARAIEWLEKAAAKGLSEAAASLGHIYENTPKPILDREKAIEWYYKAGVGYHKAGRREDAAAMIKILQTLAAKYPAVYQLISELENLVTAKPAAK